MKGDYKQIVDILREASHIFLAGDGGSAAMADHFACDLLKNCHLPAISLCSNTAVITAIANDYSFDEVFSKQLEILFKRWDVLVVFSGSGKSKNLIKALQAVAPHVTIVISGHGGALLKDYATVLFDLESEDQLECEDKMSEFCHNIVKEWGTTNVVQ